MPPRYSLPDSVLWSVIVSRVPGRLIGLLKLGRSGRSRFNTCGARHRGRRSPPIKRLQNNRSSQLDQNSRHNIQGNYKKKLRCRAATWEESELAGPSSRILGTLQRRHNSQICALAESQSFFLVLPNNLPETFPCGQTCCSVVVFVRQVEIGVVQKSAPEMRVLSSQMGSA